MKKLSQDTSGVWAVGVVLAVVIILMIVIIGLDVLKKDKNRSPNATDTSQSSQQKSETKTDTENSQDITLADNQVNFRVPKSWSDEGVGCTSSDTAYLRQEYEDSILLYPGEKLPTRYGEGTEYFNIRVCIFANKDNLSPETWYTDGSKGIGASQPSRRDTVSRDSVNGYDAYYHKQVTSDYEEVHYVVTANDKIVYVVARTYEPGQLADKPVGDFRKFEPDIAALVKSLSIK